MLGESPWLPALTTGQCATMTRHTAPAHEALAAPSTPLANYLSQVQARVAAFPNFFYFTAQCRNSLVLRGAAECYFVFDQTALRTGIAAIKNVGPYPGISLLTCVLQLDAGPPKTSAICFDKGGVDPAHPYVVARVESGVPEYNLQQVSEGWGGVE